MQIKRTGQLTEDEKRKVWSFLDKFEYIPYQQFPEYGFIEGLPTTSWVASEGGEVTGWVQVVEKRIILASIEFGPLGSDDETISALLLEVLNYYKKPRFWIARWMPYCYTPETDDAIGRVIRSKFLLLPPKGEINWASKRISLFEPPESILKKFSENHRRSVKKAQAAAIDCRLLEDRKEVDQFSAGYVRMYRHRGLQTDADSIRESFSRLHQYLSESGKGFFIGAFKDDILLGGLIVIYQGKSAFYYKGFTDHDQRQLPVNHICFYRAILRSREDKMSWFDFGGYAVDTTDDQLSNINKFKDGFRGQLITFPQTRIIALRKLSRVVYSGLQFKKRLQKTKNK